MVRTLCILTLLTVAAYLCWSTTEAAGSAATKQGQSAAAPALDSPGDASEAPWPLDAQARSETAPTDSEATEEPSDAAAADIADQDDATVEAIDRPVSLSPAWIDETNPSPTTSRHGSVGGAFGRTADKPGQVEPAPTKKATDGATELDEEPAGEPGEVDDGDDLSASAGLKRESDEDPSEATDAESITSRKPEKHTDVEPDSASNASDPTKPEPNANPAPPAAAPVRRQPLSSELRALSTRVRRVLNTYYKRRLNSRDHNPWEIMHAIIAYGVHTKIHRGGPKGPTVNAVSFLCWNGPCHGIEMLYVDKNRVNARKGPYVQGHYAQLLAILAQSRVPKDYPLRVGDRRFTIEDLIETEKLTCDEGMELTFKLISFAHYCDSDMKWKNDKGDDWDIPRLIKEELRAPILSNAACGGTHRLTALAYAVRMRGKQGHPIDGPWLRAQKYLNDYHRYNFSLQNADGSFSTEWFRKREARDDLDRRLQTSGHILEWFVYSLPEEQLTDPRVVRAVKYVSGILAAQPGREWEIGPLGHALHALVIYDQRVFKAAEAEAAAAPVARAESPTAPPARSEEAARDAAADRTDEAVTATDDDRDIAAEHDAQSSASDGTTADPSIATGAAAAQPPVDGTGAIAQTPHESSASSAVEQPTAADSDTTEPVASTPSDVPEVARRGMLRRPFARRSTPDEPPGSAPEPVAQPPRVDIDPTPASPTDAAADLLMTNETPYDPAVQRSPDEREAECADVATEFEPTLEPAAETRTPPATEIGSDDSATAREPKAPEAPDSATEGPKLFSAPASVPAAEPLERPSTDLDGDPRMEPSSPTDEAKVDEPPSQPGANLDPPPTSSLEEPPRVRPSIRANQRRDLPPPVEHVEDGPSDSGAPVRPQPEAGPQRSPVTPQHIAPRPGGTTPGTEVAPPLRPRRPRVDSRYSRPLPEYSPYSGRQVVPPARGSDRQLPARTAAPYGTRSRPGTSAIGPRPSFGTDSAVPRTRTQTVRPNAGVGGPTTSRPLSERPMRSLWPWGDDERSGASRNRASESSNRRRPRPYSPGPGE